MASWTRLVATAAVVALVAAGCAYGGTPFSTGALSAGDLSVTETELDDDIAWVASNTQASAGLFGTDFSAAGTNGGADPAVRRDAAVQLLNIYAFTAVLDAGAAADGIEPTADELGDAATQVDSLGQQAPGMPDTLRQTLVRLVALQSAVGRAVTQGAGEPTPEEIRQAYDDAIGDGSRFDDYACVSHILVSFGDGPPGASEPTDAEDAAARAAIDAAEARLGDGEAFTEVAAEVSDDPGSAARGGDLGCNFGGTFVPEFEQALYDLEPGEVSAPVRTQFGYHLIQLRSLGAPDFDDVADDIAQELTAQRQDPNTFLAALLDRGGRGIEVSVNPRFGSWDSDRLQVVPPQGPQPAPTVPGGAANGFDLGGVDLSDVLGGP